MDMGESGGGAGRGAMRFDDVAGRQSGMRGNHAAMQRPAAGHAPKGAGLALGLALAAGLGLGMLGGGDAAAESGKGAAKAGAGTVGTGQAVAAGTVTADTTTETAGTAKGDGATPAEAAPLEVEPTDITADSLISRHQAAPRDPNKGPVTNLPLPRYVSLKGGEGNARRGPSLSHRIDWVFRHPGMPLRVVAEFGHWRRVEDQDGAGGWVHYSLLSGVRTAIVMTDMAELRARPDQNASVIARAEAGAIVRLHECNKGWCRVSGGGEKGWVAKTSLWGVDPDEIRD